MEIAQPLHNLQHSEITADSFRQFIIQIKGNIGNMDLFFLLA